MQPCFSIFSLFPSSSGLAVFYYLAFLTFVTLIMRTILIAQMAATYNSLNRDAVHQLELNRSWVLPSLEQTSLMNGKWSLVRGVLIL